MKVSSYLGTCTTAEEWEMKKAKGWVSVNAKLPKQGEWVQVFIDNNDNPQDGAYCRVHHRPMHMVKPARLSHVGQEGHPYWQQSGQIMLTNVTYWKPLSDGPPEEFHIKEDK